MRALLLELSALSGDVAAFSNLVNLELLSLTDCVGLTGT